MKKQAKKFDWPKKQRVGPVVGFNRNGIPMQTDRKPKSLRVKESDA